MYPGCMPGRAAPDEYSDDILMLTILLGLLCSSTGVCIGVCDTMVSPRTFGATSFGVGRHLASTQCGAGVWLVAGRCGNAGGPFSQPEHEAMVYESLERHCINYHHLYLSLTPHSLSAGLLIS